MINLPSSHYMSFFFRGFYKKNVLALPSFIMAVKSCWIVQIEVQESAYIIMKSTPHGSWRLIKASCSEPMHLCKNNIHIYTSTNRNL